MNNLESQMWSLNEKYGVLSASYSVLREKFESYQNNYSGPNLSSLNRIHESGVKQVPSFLTPTGQSSGIVRMISVDSQSQKFDRKEISKKWTDVVDENERESHGKKKAKQNTAEGLGLQAMVAAASLHFESKNNICEESPLLRSSLADLLNAANFNACDGGQIPSQIKTEMSVFD